MKLLQTVSMFLLMVSSSECVDITVTGTEGGQVTIKCPYAKGYENSNKYFQKGTYKQNIILIESNGGESLVFDGRFSLRDDHQMRTFTVIIRNLSLADAGPYGCRSGWKGEYKQIKLHVIRAPQKTRVVQILTSTLHPDQTISSFPNTLSHLSTSDMNSPPSTITIADHHIFSTVAVWKSNKTQGNHLKQKTEDWITCMSTGLNDEEFKRSRISETLKARSHEGLLSSSIVEFNPVLYEQIKDAGRDCNPEDRDTETTVVYTCSS